MSNELKYRQDFEVELQGQVFKLTCYCQDTRTGFRHLCFMTHMCEDGEPSTKDYIVKVCYVNRTWESYPYEAVLRKALKAIYQGRMLSQICPAMDTARRVN